MPNYQNKCWRCGEPITRLDPSLSELQRAGIPGDDYLCSWCFHQWEDHWKKM